MAGEKACTVSIKNLSFTINQTEILKNVNLEVNKGEFVGLIGPNGAGKTTLLKCINGINKAAGDIWIKGANLRNLGDKQIAREVALMHQNTSMAFSFPALDVVLMGRYPYLGRLARESREDYEIARKNMQYTDTIKLEKSLVTQISGGERQRVMFAKALTQETDIILLDEPTASLDITFQEQIFKLSQELANEGKTVIAAVHDLKIAARYCSRLVLMKDGRIAADGSPEEVLTSRNLSEVYDVNALVYRNRVTGLLDMYVHGRNGEKSGKKVHVIGGGGSASGVIRQLFEKGFSISAGVFAHGDSDLQSAEIFDIKYLEGEPFNDITDSLHEENINLIRNSNLTVICNMPFGRQNIRNLEAAKHAEKLVIIEDDTPQSRDFTGGKAVAAYEELKRRAIVTTSARLHEVL